jgi:choline-sulfatase
VPSNGKRIREDIPNIGQWFEEHSDYETVYAGKWHLPNSRIRSIEGFNVISTGLGGPGFLGDASVSSACEAFIRNRSSQTPFLMVASFLQPHDICEWLRINTFVPEDPRYPQLADELPPLPANFDYDKREPEYLQRQRERNEPNIGNWTEEHWRYYLWSYYRHIEMVDAEIGRIIDALEESGQRKNTLVLLISDHGEGLAGQQTVRKSNPYDGASKVPFVVSWPGSVASGQPDSRHLVSHLDIVPTLCDYGGINTPSNMRGHSLRRILEGESVDTHDFVVTEMPGDRARLARTKQFKFVSYAGDPVELFFDRVKDPEETTNVASDPAYTSDIEDHRKLVRDWERHLEPFPKTVNREAWWR